MAGNKSTEAQAFRELRDSLTAPDPVETLKRCGEFVRLNAHAGPRLSECDDVGTWLPQYALNAVAAALAGAQRALKASSL